MNTDGRSHPLDDRCGTHAAANAKVHQRGVVREAKIGLDPRALHGLERHQIREDRIRVLAETHEKVLRATFEPADALKERIERGTLSVGALEKVALSPDRFDIRG